MTCDDSYILNSMQRENASLTNEIDYLRKEIARLLIEKDEAREMSLKLANSLDQLVYWDCGRDIAIEVLDEYFSVQRGQE